MNDIGAHGIDDSHAVGERNAAVEPAFTRSFQDQEVTVVETCRLDPNADLATGGFGLDDFGAHQATCTCMAIQMIGLHRCSLHKRTPLG